jgi:hypothetical protein
MDVVADKVEALKNERMGPPGPCSSRSGSHYSMSRTCGSRDIISLVIPRLGDNSLIVVNSFFPSEASGYKYCFDLFHTPIDCMFYLIDPFGRDHLFVLWPRHNVPDIVL